jgi:hypothetical protein
MRNFHPDHLSDLKKSGLSDETIQASGIASVPPKLINKRLVYAPPDLTSMYVIPYGEDFLRYRCFYAEGKTGPKYLQKKNAGNQLYIPPLAASVLNDQMITLYITEGEKKALKACQEGIPCIGLSGLWNWKEKEKGLIPDFHKIELKHRTVYIVPDNDWRSPNKHGYDKNLEQAVYSLAKSLQDCGAVVRICILPEGPAKGLDDYLCSHTSADFFLLEEMLYKTDNGVKSESFIGELNRHHAVINFIGRFCIMEETIDQASGHHKIQFSSPADFKNFYAYRFVLLPHSQREDKMVKTCIADAWIHSPQRREYKGIVFEPMEDVPDYYNLWQGFAVQPKAGVWSLMREHIENIICQRNKDIARWVFAWMARIVQKPGKDLQGTCIVLMGGLGVGKGIFAREFGSLFGAHYLHLNSSNQLTGQFNAHLANKLLVFCDEMLWDGDKKAEGVIKGLITEPTFPIQYKFKDIFNVKNYANFIIASNSSWVVPAGEKERRFCVLDVSPEKAGDTQYFLSIMNQMNNGGREAMLYDLQRLDITGINLRIIPKTIALTNQVIQNLESVPKFWLHCLTNPKSLPKIKDGERSCVIKSELYDSYCDFCKKNSIRHILSSNSFGKAIRKYCPGMQDGRSSMAKRPTLYILPPLTECRGQFEKAIGMVGVFEN